ncbi:PHP C-terminal domain protein [Desulforamulus reducens MI-1]|uniref:PHP C-terminal domain protein n=2 Tax=Desulforamulus TaxID=2916693 RepID=A4J5T2_DESRM|nr:PHP C-terminal domain protein [Desulforamulus reducens MI-1]
MQYADLHIHTTASDGSDTPSEVVHKALEIGLRAIAISDHDTMDGVLEAERAAEKFNLEVISGVEVNTFFEGKEIHILGYLIDPCNEKFVAKLKELQGDRMTRIKKMVDKLNKLNIKIELERVLELSSGGSVGRPHIARALVERGYVLTLQEAFTNYLGVGKPAFVSREKLSPKEAIRLITRAKGVPVLAHPGLSKINTYLLDLVNEGLKGLEVWHKNHTPLMVEYYAEIAKKYNLVPTGGSDYHGSAHDTCNILGGAVAPFDSVQLLKNAHQKLF